MKSLMTRSWASWPGGCDEPPSFSVLTGPWIPVIRLDGSRDELGILPCVRQAHELREIRDPSPIVEFGIYRLLVAFVLDALILAGRRPEDPLDLKRLIGDGHFDLRLIENYIEQCGDVFDLFHPERPFLQNAQTSGEPKSIFDFYPVFPSGANVIHFSHQRSEEQIERPSGIARLLVTVSPFNVKVKTGQPRTITGDPPIYALPVGESLHETIIANLPLPDPRFTMQEEMANGPIWRSLPRDGQSGTTPTQSFTWPCRFVKVSPPDRDDYVRCIINNKGLGALGGWKDPSCAVFEGNDGRIRHLRLEESRPLWLDAGPLSFYSGGSVRRWGKKEWVFVRPQVIDTALAVSPEEDLQIQVYAWRTDQAKVLEWIRCQWSIPSRLGQSTRLGSLVQRELDRAEHAAYRAHGLRSSIKALYPREAAGNKEALGCIAARCERAYWQRLESSFHPLMSAFAELDPNAPDDPTLIAATARNWREAIRNLALEQFESAAKDMDADGDALKRQVHARTRLNSMLRKVLS